MAATAAAAGPVAAAGDNQPELLLEGFVVIPTTLKSEEKSDSQERTFSNENWRVYFQPEEVIAFITSNDTSLIMHVKMEMVGADFENRNSIIYLTTYEFIEKYTHDETTGPTVASSPDPTSHTGLTLTTPFVLNAETKNPVAASSNSEAALRAANEDPIAASPNPEAEAEAKAEAEAEAKVASPAAAAAANSSNQNTSLQEWENNIDILRRDRAGKDVNLQFGIAKYNTHFKDGWRHATGEEWMTPQFQAALILDHITHMGWKLLQNPLTCNDSLYVNEGEVNINGNNVVEVGFNLSQELRGVYPAMNFGTNVSWTKMQPKVDDTWSVVPKDINNTTEKNPPCLFVKEPIQNNPLEKELNNVNFAVGHHGKLYAEWEMILPSLLLKHQNIIVATYLKNNGFVLLEKPFIFDNNILHFSRGQISSNGTFISRNRNTNENYVINNWDSIKDTNWTITKVKDLNTIKNNPYLFIRSLFIQEILKQ